MEFAGVERARLRDSLARRVLEVEDQRFIKREKYT